MALSNTMKSLVKSLSCVTARGDQHTMISIKEKDRLATLRSVTLEARNGGYTVLYGGTKRTINKLRTGLLPQPHGRSDPDNAYELEVSDGAHLYLNQFM